MMYWTLSKASAALGPVVEEQQDPGRHLHGEEKERHPAQVIEDRVPVDRDFLLRRQVSEVLPPEPIPDPRREREAGGGARRQLRRRTILSPRTLTSILVSGRGGGPETLVPLAS